MDRELPTSIRRRARIVRFGIIAAILVALAVAITLIAVFTTRSVKESELLLGQVERGALESAVTTNGKIVAAYEEIIVSPVNSRLLEIYVHEGDSVVAGTPLMRLDLESTRTEYQRLADEVTMKEGEMRQTNLNGETSISQLEMQIRTKAMAVDALEAEYRSEVRLDSIGSGTGERVRQAELAWATGRLELQQMRRQLDNERLLQKAAAHNKRLETDISRRSLAEASRTLDEARISANRSGIITYLANEIGATISAGTKMAVISDLSHFKAQGELPDAHADKLAVGTPVEVRSSGKVLRGHVANTTPQSKSGVIPFTVSLDNDFDPAIRAGRTAQISIIYDSRPDILRIPAGSFFQGPGNYTLFVRTADDRLEQRHVTLGESNPDYVEVLSGLVEGESVVISDMKDYQTYKSLKIKN